MGVTFLANRLHDAQARTHQWDRRPAAWPVVPPNPRTAWFASSASGTLRRDQNDPCIVGMLEDDEDAEEEAAAVEARNADEESSEDSWLNAGHDLNKPDFLHYNVKTLKRMIEDGDLELQPFYFSPERICLETRSGKQMDREHPLPISICPRRRRMKMGNKLCPALMASRDPLRLETSSRTSVHQHGQSKKTIEVPEQLCRRRQRPRRILHLKGCNF